MRLIISLLFALLMSEIYFWWKSINSDTNKWKERWFL